MFIKFKFFVNVQTKYVIYLWGNRRTGNPEMVNDYVDIPNAQLSVHTFYSCVATVSLNLVIF